MKTNSEYKDLALEAIDEMRGVWRQPAVVTFIYLLVFGAVPALIATPLASVRETQANGFGLSGIITLLLLPLVWGIEVYFLDLSMIGWAILSSMTFGIGYIFLIPYNQTAHAAFYEDLKAEQADGVAWN